MAAHDGMKKKRKMQKVRFESMEEFFDYLAEDELKIVTRLRDLVMLALPDCIEKLAYNVPYYKRHTNICFIWPASVQWGNSQQKGVRLGFTKGYLLSVHKEYLDKGERKQVYWKDFSAVKEIDADILLPLLYEAALVDELSAKTKKKSDGSTSSIKTKNRK